MTKKIFITLILILTTALCVNAESLFTLGASQSYSGAPKPLYSGVRAMSIGDLVSIILDEQITSTDNLSFSSTRESVTVDNFTNVLKDLFGLGFLKSTNNYGGSNEVSSGTNNSRTMSFGNTIAAQVVQMQPNGNLVLQGKKTLVSGNERMDLIVTGIVDPRWINPSGEVYSSNIANLQFALSGRGSTSRNQNEGIFNRIIRYLF